MFFKNVLYILVFLIKLLMHGNSLKKNILTFVNSKVIVLTEKLKFV